MDKNIGEEHMGRQKCRRCCHMMSNHAGNIKWW